MFLGSLESFVGRRAAKWQNVHGIHSTSENARALCWKNLKMGLKFMEFLQNINMRHHEGAFNYAVLSLALCR